MFNSLERLWNRIPLWVWCLSAGAWLFFAGMELGAQRSFLTHLSSLFFALVSITTAITKHREVYVRR